MSKSKVKNNHYNSLVVNKVAEMYGFMPRYVRAVLKGDYQGIMPDNIKKDYKHLCKEIDQATEKAVENIINQ